MLEAHSRLLGFWCFSNSDDHLLKNIELFDKLSLRFNGRVLFIKDVIGDEICCWSFYGQGRKLAEVCCTSIVYATEKKQTKVCMGCLPGTDHTDSKMESWYCPSVPCPQQHKGHMYFPKYGMMVPGWTEPGPRLEVGQTRSAAEEEQQGTSPRGCGRARSLKLSQLRLQLWSQLFFFPPRYLILGSHLNSIGLCPYLQTWE